MSEKLETWCPKFETLIRKLYLCEDSWDATRTIEAFIAKVGMAYPNLRNIRKDLKDVCYEELKAQAELEEKYENERKELFKSKNYVAKVAKSKMIKGRKYKRSDNENLDTVSDVRICYR